MTMNLITISRKPYLAFFLAIAVLFASCEQYDQSIQKTQNQFDYTAFENFKNNSTYIDLIEEIKNENLKNKNQSVLERNKAVVSKINSRIGTNLELPNAVLELKGTSSENIFKKSSEKEWITEENIYLIKEFNSDLKKLDFNQALVNYQNKVLKLDLTSEEFLFNNNFVNIVKSLNYQNPSVFKSNMIGKNLKSSGWWDCAASSVALAAAIAGTISCVTIVACAIAMICVYSASKAFARNCLE